ncbi:hypothetical protein OROMI_011884 [Orobanche minor]
MIHGNNGVNTIMQDHAGDGFLVLPVLLSCNIILKYMMSLTWMEDQFISN